MLSELESLKESWNRAWFEKDAKTIDRLMAADYVYIAPNGQILDRKTILGIVCSPTYHLDHGSRSELVVRPIGTDAAVIRDRWQGAGSYQGTAFVDDHRCLIVCARMGGTWQIVLEQCTENSADSSA